MNTPSSNYDPTTGTFKRSNTLGLPKDHVAAMYGDYEAGMSLIAVGKRHRGITGGTVREIFAKRGLALRVPKNFVSDRHAPNGCFLPATPKTEPRFAASFLSER